MKFSVIIPAYNEAEELPATLAALRSAISGIDGSGEIIVVDNNSSDATAAVAAAHGADRVVFEPVNQIARARNAGAGAAGGDYLLFVDADTRVPAGLPARALARMTAGTCGGGGALVEFEGGNRTWVGALGVATWRRLSRSLKLAAGSFVFCRRDAFDAVGGFDTRLYAGEEVRFSNRLKRWCRGSGLSFEVIADHPVRTSARKLEWYSGPRILCQVALTALLLPLAVRSRRLCSFWYRRPAAPPRDP